MEDLSWLAGPTVPALRDGLRAVLPELADRPLVPRGLEESEDPRYRAASAVVDGRFVVKFAWSRPAALRMGHQARVLAALRSAAPRLPLPEVVAVSSDPAVLVLRWVPGKPFFDIRHHIAAAQRDQVATDLATALAQLHDPLRARFVPLARPDQRPRILSWCDWADAVLTRPGRTVLVHGDLHGDNHLWDPGTLRLRLVIDLETVGTGEPEFDLRCLPGDCGPTLFTATATRYEQLTGTPVDLDRVLAWHLRTVLGDALWRTEAGVPLPDHRTATDWVDDLAARFAALGVGPADR